MKNNKKHPLTFFREEGEKRKAMFQKGGYNIPVQKLKKAQDGIEMENDMMINKPGYGAKKTVNPTKIQAVPVRSNPVPGPEWKSAQPKVISAEEAARRGIYHKKGGSVKRKK